MSLTREMLDDINTTLCQSWFGYGWEYSHLGEHMNIICKTVESLLPHISF